MPKWSIIPLALIALCSVPSRAGAQISDQILGERVADAVLNYSQFSIYDDINIGVENRVVTLTGRVTRPKKKDEIAARVAKVDGVRSVINDIGILPVSRTDDILRERVASAIYNHPAFWMSGQQANPPIHIVIEGGNITLTGVVDSDVQRALASSLAQVGGQIGVTNKLKVSRR